jgi:hypothetical protein
MKSQKSNNESFRNIELKVVKEENSMVMVNPLDQSGYGKSYRRVPP